MGFPDNVLEADEEVVLDLRPHWRRLVVPVVVLVVLAGVVSFLWFVVPHDSARLALHVVVTVVGILVLVRWVVRPWLRWRSTRYVVTTRRLMVRSGVASRSGRDIPLTRVTDVSFRSGLGDRLYGSGTLLVDSGGDRGQLVLRDVPGVQDVSREVYALVEEEIDRLRYRAGPGW